MLHHSGNLINIEDEDKIKSDKEKLITICIVWIPYQAESETQVFLS